MTYRHWRYSGLLAILLVTAGAAFAADADKPLTPQQKRETAGFLYKFRTSAKDPEARAKAVDGLLEIGGAAVPQLLDAVNKELLPLQARYKTDFLKAALQVQAARIKAAPAGEVDTQRRAVLDLGSDPGLTHEAIVAKGDPAMAKLAACLSVDREAVLKDADALKKERDGLQALGGFWERAMADLSRPAPKPDPAAKADPAAKPDPPAPAAPKFEETLVADEEICALCALASGDDGRKILLDNMALEAKLPLEEARGLRDVNRIRLLLGLKALRIDLGLCDAARDHSKDMSTKGFFAHESPVPGKKTPWDRAKNFGTTASAENITMGATGAEVDQQWFHSPGHHKNMLGNHVRMGLGNFQKHWTQMFGD